jgi:hypothetical protein
MCGAKSKTSMRKESSVRRRVRILRINIPSRYRGECEGECAWDVAASINMMRTKKAAIGWRTRIEERVVRVLIGKSKLPF